MKQMCFFLSRALFVRRKEINMYILTLLLDKCPPNYTGEERNEHVIVCKQMHEHSLLDYWKFLTVMEGVALNRKKTFNHQFVHCVQPQLGAASSGPELLSNYAQLLN